MNSGSKQVSAPPSLRMGPDAFAQSDETALWWLTNAGFLINAHGTLVMMDPAISLAADGCGLSETGHRLLVSLPIEARQVPRLDAVLYTHADYDHYAPATARELMRTSALFVGPPPVADVLRKLGAEHVHVARAGEAVEVGRVRITVTPADHPWQARDPAKFGPPWKPEACCGYLIATPDGTIWHPGDTRLMEEHLRFRDVEVLLLDVSRNEYHLGVESAARLANALERALIIPHHYGSYDHPDPSPYNPYNGDPAEVAARVQDGGRRFRLLAPGEKMALGRRG